MSDPRRVEPTPFSGITWSHQWGLYSIGVESFHHQAGHEIAVYRNDKMLLAGGKPWTKIEICSVSASVRPPDPIIALWGTEYKKTDGLFRVFAITEDGRRFSPEIVNIIVKATIEPGNVCQSSVWGWTLPPCIGLEVELQVAGSGGNKKRPSNLELQATGRCFG